MYNLIVVNDIKKGDLLVVDKIVGKSLHCHVIDTTKAQVRTGPSFKPTKPIKPEKGNK